MNLKCAIVDDEPLALGLLESYVNKTPFLELVGKYSSAVQAIKELPEKHIDLLFLDIQMPELNGLEFSKMVDFNTRIVFTTAFDQYAIDGYKVNALDYLLKPISYIDFLQAGGPTILGSNYGPVREAAIELLRDCGPVTGLLHEAELLIAKEIHKHMPNVEMFRMLGSGTESVMAALRIARIATDHKRIIKIGGAYHGWSDQMVYGLKIPGSRALLESHGIPRGAYKLTDEVRPNDLEMLEKMLKRNRKKGGTAAVIVEPVGPESGTRPVARNYNKGVRELCDKYGALMIFDEVVTGFRVALSGAQGYFDVVPDLTIFGKIVAGGYPAAGGVGGKKGICAADGGRTGYRQT